MGGFFCILVCFVKTMGMVICDMLKIIKKVNCLELKVYAVSSFGLMVAVNFPELKNLFEHV